MVSCADNNNGYMRFSMRHKLSLYVVGLMAGLLLFCPRLVFADTCRVTSTSGSTFTEGSLPKYLLNPNCTVIEFDVGSVEPLTNLMKVRPGVTINGGGIEIRYALPSENNWRDGNYKTCLLRIEGDGTEGVTISNLKITNLEGMGICVLDKDGTRANGNKISNVFVTAGTRGIDLGSSDYNIIDKSTIVGVGTTATEGVYTTGRGNSITKAKIENFNNGVKVDRNDAAPVYISQATFSKMRGKPIDYLAGATGAPKDIRAAFVDDSTFALTGTMEAVFSAFTPNNVEVYTVTTSGSLTTYKYKTTLSSNDFISRGAGTLLGENERRFVHVFDIARDGLSPTQKIALLATRGVLLFFNTSEMSAIYDGSNPIEGGSDCAGKKWFWWSYDRTTGDDAYRGWDVDYDGDGIPNSCTQATCSDPKMAEDLNKDCAVRANESDPTSWQSQYDFDCDGISDRLIAGKKDNCVNLLKPDGTQYTQTTRAAAPACSASSNLDFKSYNPAQTDTNRDGFGDACVDDADGDSANDGVDNCPLVANPDQLDSDGDGQGDACQQMRTPPANATPADADGDGTSTLRDNCPFTANADQKDTDQDGVGDGCDPDADNDGLTNAEEIEASTLSDSPDTDGDGICDGPAMGFGGLCIRPRDNCPLVANRDQKDQDEDGIGDACDAAPTVYLGDDDSDGDGFRDGFDNCPIVRNPSPMDWDRDGLGDPCDADDDNDGLDDATESGLFDPYLKEDPAHQNRMFADVDGDGTVDWVDVCMNSANQSGSDLDGDGVGDACDLDDDNDDGHESVDTCQDYLVSQRGVQTVMVGASVGRATRTCDYDESAQLKLAPWDPDSDHKGGDIFQVADGFCDGAGSGYGSVGGPNNCTPSDVCPIFYNPTQQGCAPPVPPEPSGSDVPPAGGGGGSGSGSGGPPITEPGHNIRGGCQLVQNGSPDLSFLLLGLGFGLLLFSRRSRVSC